MHIIPLLLQRGARASAQDLKQINYDLQRSQSEFFLLEESHYGRSALTAFEPSLSSAWVCGGDHYQIDMITAQMCCMLGSRCCRCTGSHDDILTIQELLIESMRTCMTDQLAPKFDQNVQL
jgi:hypothetical protein